MLLGGARHQLHYDMFNVERTASEARRARRMESIYHVGQSHVWDGREVLSELVKKHGIPSIGDDERRALASVLGVIMWGELAAWNVSAELVDAIVPLEAKLAATAQVHDEARHFYVMHDYLALLGIEPKPLDSWARQVIQMTLNTRNLTKKLLGMQLTIETIALVIFQRLRELNVEPVLTELLGYFERDEARHVGLGVQMVPPLMARMPIHEAIGLGLFQMRLLGAALMSLKNIERDLLTLGIDPRSVLAIGFKKQIDLQAAIRAEFPNWPQDPPVRRAFEGLCEIVFPTEKELPSRGMFSRLKHAVDIVRRTERDPSAHTPLH